MNRFLLFLLVDLLSVAIFAQTKPPRKEQVFIKFKYASDCIYYRTENTSSEDEILPDKWSKLVVQYKVLSIKPAFTKISSPKLDAVCVAELADSMLANRFIREIGAFTEIEYAEKVPRYQLFYTPNDLNSQQWNLSQIQATKAWDITKGKKSVKIAIIDDAVLTSHEDLKANIWINPGEIPNNGIDDEHNGYIDDVNGYDVADNDDDPQPDDVTNVGNFTHGTHCAGIAGAVTNNGTGIASIGFNISVISVKAKSSSNTGPILDATYQGVEYAIAAKANVISIESSPKNSSD